MPAPAQSAHYPVTVDRIVEAMNGMGLAIAPAQVTLLSTPIAATASPRLTVRSIERWNSQRMMIRLECEDPAQCVPFFVNVRTDPNATGAKPSARNTTGRPLQIESFPRPSYASPVVRQGSPATLLLEGVHIHIRLSVICLDSGSPGQTIRVTDRDHREVYTAQIIDASTLAGRL